MSSGNYHPPIRFLQWVARVYNMITGWRIEGNLPDLPKYVVIVAPHTSNWDLIVILAAKFLLSVRGRWYAKESLFWWPQGAIMRVFGGLPIVRSKNSNVVMQAIEAFSRHSHFILGLAPEGTRDHVEEFKTGFYHIAKGAEVPVVPVGLDYGKKQLVFFEPLFLTEDFEADMEKIYQLFQTVEGKFPEKTCQRCQV